MQQLIAGSGLGTGQWKDLILPVVGLGKGVTEPSMATFVGNIETYIFQTGDLLFGSFEIQHDYEEGTDLYCHVHWSPNSTNTGNVVFDFEYTIQNVNSVFPASETLTVTQAAAGAANTHQLASLSPVISGTNLKIGAIVVFRLLRNATGNTFTGNCFMHSVGIHYKCNSIGSNQIATK